jgi:hypothetical protein
MIALRPKTYDETTSQVKPNKKLTGKEKLSLLNKATYTTVIKNKFGNTLITSAYLKKTNCAAHRNIQIKKQQITFFIFVEQKQSLPE